MAATTNAAVPDNGRQAEAWRDANAAEFLFANKDKSRTALHFLDINYTYGELEEAAWAVRNFLVQADPKKGDRVVLVSENSFFWVATYLGTLLSGLTACPWQRASPRRSSNTFADYGAAVLFPASGIRGEDRMLLHDVSVVTDRRFPDGRSEARVLTFDEVCARERRLERDGPTSGGDDLAALMFTSGSTGRPRGVMVSHTNLIANTNSIIQALQLTEAIG